MASGEVAFWVPGYRCFMLSVLFIFVAFLQSTNSTPSPSVVGQFCNIFDGTSMDNVISPTFNAKLSDVTISDPLRIKFTASFYSVDMCTTVECNLIQIGVSSSTETEKVLFPRVSIQNVNKTQNAFTWYITLQIGSTSNNISIPQTGFTFPGSSTFDITLTGQTVIILIGSNRYTRSFPFIQQAANLSGLHPLYASSGECCEVDSFGANITQLCASTDSLSPTKAPTRSPTMQPTSLKPTTVTAAPSAVASYTKIDCYTETGTAGTSTVECTAADYFPTSCGIKYTNSSANPYNNTFMRGWYIERANPNQLELEPVCHIDYGTTLDSIKSALTPQARCCNFNQQYGNSFKCRYFISAERRTDLQSSNNRRSSTVGGATKANEVTYITCDDEYPLLLGCAPYVFAVDAVPNGTDDDRFVAGSFVAETSTAESDTYYNKYFSLFNESIVFPPTTYAPTKTQPTTQPTEKPTTTVYFNISSASPYSQCVAQYGPITYNYSLTAVATCCTENYTISSDETCCLEPTPAPTSMPTVLHLLNTDTFGRGVNFGGVFSESGADGPIVGISKWAIIQVNDYNGGSPGNKLNIPYQGLLIGEYQQYRKYNLKANETKEVKTILTDSDYGHWQTGEFVIETQCGSFVLDTINGTRDHINGFDLFWTRFAIFGVRFHTKFGRIYSCPDDQNFVDTSIDMFGATLSDIIEGGFNVQPNDYNMSNVSIAAPFDANGTRYGISGFEGTKQTRELNFGLERSVMANIKFIFVLDTEATPAPTSAPTESPTSAPTPSPTTVVTPSPLFPGQSAIGSETLECYAIWGKSSIKCTNAVTDTMTSCYGYSANDQLLSAYIDSSSVCNVEAMRYQTAVAANAICCRFYVAPPRDYNIFIWLSISGGSLYFAVLLAIGIHWYFIDRPKKYFRESDIDKDDFIDQPWESDVHGTKAKQNIADLQAKHRDLIEMQRQQSDDSVGLER